MKPEQPCEVFLDELTGRESSSPALLQHLKECQACQGLQSSIQVLRGVPSVFPDPLVDHFTKKALEGLPAGHLPTSTVPFLPLIVAGTILFSSVFWLVSRHVPARPPSSKISVSTSAVGQATAAATIAPQPPTGPRVIGQKGGTVFSMPETIIPSSEDENVQR
jgi:hypothetical protein